MNYQSEQSAAIARQGSNVVMLVAYNDSVTDITSFAGLATSAPLTSLTVAPGPFTQSGLPASGPFDHMDSDPSIASNMAADGTGGTVVWYALLGHYIGDPMLSDRVGVSKSTAGGVPASFSSWTVASASACQDVDKPSVEVSPDGKSAHVAYVCDTGSSTPTEIHVASSISGGAWSDAKVATLPANVYANANPIIRHNPLLPTRLLVTWEEDPSTTVRVVKAAASATNGTSWSSFPAPVPGATTADPPFVGFGGAQIRDKVHYAFEYDQNNECYVAYTVSGRIFVTTSTGGPWATPVPIPNNSMYNEFQPMLSSSPNSVAVSYYAQFANNPATVVGARLSTDHGATWGSDNEQLSQVGGGFVTDGFQPCPLQVTSTDNYFGDYVGLTTMWTPWLGTTSVSTDYINKAPTRFFTIWADSRPSCIQQSSTTAIHQHSVGELWGL